MGQYRDKVELQKQILKAEEYKDTPKWIHSHRLTSMWYETKESVKDVEDGVMDIQYMDGRIERENLKTGKRTVLVKGLTGEDLVQEVTRNLADSGTQLG